MVDPFIGKYSFIKVCSGVLKGEDVLYNADTEAKRLMVQDEVIRKELVALVGEEVYQGAELNKPLLASYLFSSAEHVQQINSIVHPRVKADFIEWLKARLEYEVAGIESAILFEAGFRDSVDSVIMVSAPEELRLARAMKRDRATEQQIRNRMSAQMNEDEKIKMADFVICNDETQPLNEQISFILQILKTSKK